MSEKKARFFTQLEKSKAMNVAAFILYFLFIFTSIKTNLPLVLQIPITIVQLLIFIVFYIIFLSNLCNKLTNNIDTLFHEIWKKIKKIVKEILMYIPFSMLSTFILSFIVVGESNNQTSVVESFNQSPIFYAIIIVIIGPILEEFIFRYLPYKFIKNKILYVIISSFIFAWMHVFDDPKAFYYILAYLPDSLYFGYRYYKTKDLAVTFSIHSFGNLVAVILIAFF